MSPANLLHPAETTEHDPVSAMEVEISDELELNDDAPPQSLVTPIVIPPRPSASDDDVPSPQRMRVLELLVRMADQYARNGMVRQAIELFLSSSPITRARSRRTTPETSSWASPSNTRQTASSAGAAASMSDS